MKFFAVIRYITNKTEYFSGGIIMNRIKKLFISALVLMLLLIGCTTTGSVNTYKMYDISPSSNTYLGEVRAGKNVWHWFFSTGNTQVEAYNVALAEAKKQFGDNIALANVKYYGTWHPASLLLYFDMFGWIESVEVRADVFTSDVYANKISALDLNSHDIVVKTKEFESYQNTTASSSYSQESMIKESQVLDSKENGENKTEVLSSINSSNSVKQENESSSYKGASTSKHKKIYDMMDRADKTENNDNWNAEDGVDSVGNPIKADSVSQIVIGSFSNSATLNSDMAAIIEISKEEIEFGLIEYLSYIVTGDEDNIVLIEYSDNGVTKDTTGEWYAASITVKDTEGLLSAILSNDTVNVSIITGNRYTRVPSVYKFTIKQEGLAAAYLKVFYDEE